MKPSRGFTLVEMLVAVAMLSLLVLALGGSMRGIASVGERLDGRARDADEMRVALAFLGTTLERVSGRKLDPLPPAGENPFLFAGSAGEVRWVGIMPARHGAGGRTFFRLAVESVSGTPALVLRFVPWQGTAAWPDWSTAESRVLLPRVEHLQLVYAADAVPFAWQAAWTDVQRLPDRLRLSVATARGTMPDLIVPLRALPGDDAARFVRGPE